MTPLEIFNSICTQTRDRQEAKIVVISKSTVHTKLPPWPDALVTALLPLHTNKN